MTRTQATEIEILRLEDLRYAAMIAGDSDALDYLLHEACVYTHSNAARDTKASYLAQVRSGHFVYQAVDHPVERVEIVGDTAVVIGEMVAKVVTGGVPKELDNAATAIWVRTDHVWRLLSYQSTPQPPRAIA